MSVEFEPVRLGQRRRRLDPISIGTVVVAMALGAAVLKPWGGGPAAGPIAEAGSSPTPAASEPVAGPTATASVALPRSLGTRTVSSPGWAEIAPVIRRHDAWGIRAVVIRSSANEAASANQRYAERWFRFPSGGTKIATAVVDPSDQSIVALGVTFPPSHTPLDARIWRAGNDGPEWIDTQPLDPVPSGGAFLYVRPGVAGGPVRAWAAGTYRIDVLVDGSIRRLGVAIPDRFANVPEPSARPALREIRPLIDPAEAALPDLPIGLFATVDGAAVPLPADEGPPIDEAQAWLDVDPGTGRAPRSFVAAAYLPRATGLGVALPPRSVVMSATITRLAPRRLDAAPQRVDDATGSGTPSSHVLFRAPSGGPWTPGVYQLSVVWADFDGLHDEAWHVELRPGPVRELPRLLAAARSWARYAGSTGMILGTVEPLEGGPRAAVIRLVRLRPDEAVYPAASGVGCGGTVIDGHPGIIGFSYPADRYESRVSARILRPFLRRGDQVVMTAAFGVRGLILVAPARRPALVNGTYRFTLGDGADAPTYAVCLGMAAFDD